MIPAEYRHRSVYHFTPLENLPDILAHGLLSVKEQQRRGLPIRTIVWDAIQAHQATVRVPYGSGGSVDEYVPLYFTRLSPMLLAIISNKVVDEQSIIHFELPIQVMERHETIFTNGAILPGGSPIFYTRPSDLIQLNWDAIDSPLWRMPSQELRHARLAEMLVYRHIPIVEATRIIVWDNNAAERVSSLFHASSLVPPPIQTDPSCYFLDPNQPVPTPAIQGPTEIFKAYQKSLNQIIGKLNQAVSPRFVSLRDLRDALRADMSILPETAELIGLPTDNKAHFEDVGAHTRRVWSELLKTAEYQHSSAHDRVLIELAAFLHDIGKGPKARWINSGGRQQIDMDHPIKALPMLERILTEEVTGIDEVDARLLCKLIAYHDLIGGVMVAGRRMVELLAVVNDEHEFDLLMALSRADATAINPAWSAEDLRARLKEAAVQELRSRQKA